MNKKTEDKKENFDKETLFADFSYLCEISFDGTDYSGWQRQPNAKTVQGTIEKKLAYLYDTEHIPVVGSSRTDSGVHALAMAISFTPPKTPPITIETLHKALNSILPFSIRINNIEKKDINFSARFDSKAKAYTYVIHNNANSRPFSSRYSLQVKSTLNIENMIEASKYLIGEHDFSSFAVEINKTEKDLIRVIHDIRVQVFEQYICISVIGKSFLYKMVRSIIGTLLMCGMNKIKPNDVKDILEKKNRLAAYDTADSCGLFLMKVFFNDDDWKSFSLKNIPFHI